MIIQFTVGNFLSFNEKRTLSLEAKGISELKNNVFQFEKHKLLRSSVVYGANSSGKSNLIKALSRMKDIVLTSVKLNDTDNLDFSPFLLSTKNENEPTFFEISFFIENLRYRYGFEYDLKNIINEWLWTGNLKNEKPLFLRTKDGIAITDKFEEGSEKERLTNDNRLFISLSAQLGGTISKKILEFFNSYNVISGLDHNDYYGYTMRMINEKLDGYLEVLKFYQTLKLGFKDLIVEELDFNEAELPKDLPKNVKSRLIKELTGKTKVSLKTVHSKFDEKGNIVDSVVFDKDLNESEGTNKIVDLSGPIFNTLFFGYSLIIDELDSKLHPLITTHIVKLFNNPKTNPKNAQLLFATHDTNLLSADLFRRDQIWFTEKDRCEETDLYSLYDLIMPDGTKVRNDSNIEKNYIRGRYSAIPFITN